MELTLGELKACETGLSAIFASKRFNVIESLRLAHLFRVVGEKLEDMEKIRLNLIEKYGKFDEEIKAKKVTNKNLPLFYKEMEELHSQPFVVDFSPISAAKLPEDLEIGPRDLFPLLGKFIVEAEPEMKPAEEEPKNPPQLKAVKKK